jgi:hypothetical protein
MFWPNEFWLFDKIWRFCNIKLAKLEQQLIVFNGFFLRCPFRHCSCPSMAKDEIV